MVEPVVTPKAVAKYWTKVEVAKVDKLGDSIGYGALMRIASEIWAGKDSLGSLMVGPCKAATIACGCANPVECEWCCGSGWVTKKVAQVKAMTGKITAHTMQERLSIEADVKTEIGPSYSLEIKLKFDDKVISEVCADLPSPDDY